MSFLHGHRLPSEPCTGPHLGSCGRWPSHFLKPFKTFLKDAFNACITFHQLASGSWKGEAFVRLLSSAWLMLQAPGLQVPLLMFSSCFSESFQSGQAAASHAGKNQSSLTLVPPSPRFKCCSPQPKSLHPPESRSLGYVSPMQDRKMCFILLLHGRAEKTKRIAGSCGLS